MMKIYNKFYILILILLSNCSRQLDISEFSDDFANYNPEVRIEALILPSYNTAIVRIDRSVLINDTTIYNCRDDDFGQITEDACLALEGTWHFYEGENENGQGQNENGEPIADCGDWDPNIHDLGEDGQEGDLNDENENCTAEEISLYDEDLSPIPDCLSENSKYENDGRPNCGEPFVDETDEIIKKIHVDNCSVKITNGDTECILEYDEDAGSFFSDNNFGKDEEDYFLDNIETPSYAAYIPSESCSNFNWDDIATGDYECVSGDIGCYEFEADCPNYGNIKSKDPIKIPSSVVFYHESDILPPFIDNITDCFNNECLKNNSSIWNEVNQNYNVIYFARYAFNDYIYYSSISPYFYYQSVQHFYDINNDRYLYYHGHPDGATEVENIHGNASLMGEAVVTDFLEFDNDPTIKKYYYEMFTFSEEYKNYYFFDLLDLRDPVRTNLRKLDYNGQPSIPIMGAFGAMNSEKIYFEIIDCLEYDTKETCEDINNTQSVCQWYDTENNYGDINNNGEYDEGENIVPQNLLPLCGPIKMPPIN